MASPSAPCDPLQQAQVSDQCSCRMNTFLLFCREAVTAIQHDKARDPIQIATSSGTHGIAVSRNTFSSRLTAGAARRSMLQEGVQVSHPCLHEGYAKKYAWVAHGTHVTPLPKVQLLGRYC